MVPPTPRQVKEWQKLENQYLKKGFSRHSAHKNISSAIGVSVHKIYYWLTPEYRKSFLTISREFRKKQHRKKYTKHLGLSEKNYNTLYHQVTRRLDSYLYSIYPDNKHAYSIESISKKLWKVTGLKIEPKTIETILKKYDLEKGLAPIKKQKQGTYHLSLKYYTKYGL